jgi:hypothetical protein
MKYLIVDLILKTAKVYLALILAPFALIAILTK